MEGLFAVLYSGFMSIVPFIVMLSIVIFIHELGHFLTGRWRGVDADVFSIGFGKEIWGRTDKRGTRWKISWIPLGGYVKFKGDTDEFSARQTDDRSNGSFASASLFSKTLIVAAGPIANFILAFVLFFGLFFFNGIYRIDPVIDKIMPNAPAAVSGLQVGDRITAINDRAVTDFTDVPRYMMQMIGQHPESVQVSVDRTGQPLTYTVPVMYEKMQAPNGTEFEKPYLGLQKSNQQNYKPIVYQPVDSAKQAVREVKDIVLMTMSYLKDLVTLKQGPEQLTGPIGIGKMASSAAEAGLFSFINMMALLSVSIGLMNLFPLPMLDGGHLMFYLIEFIIRRPVPDKVREPLLKAGFVLLMGLMFLSTLNDLRIV